jgi:hypothetical protein
VLKKTNFPILSHLFTVPNIPQDIRGTQIAFKVFVRMFPFSFLRGIVVMVVKKEVLMLGFFGIGTQDWL